MDEKVTISSSSVLVVDLDGTLIRTDLLHESVLLLMKQNPLSLLLLPVWLLSGKAHMKQKIAERVEVPVTLLPYNRDIVEYLHEERQSGRKMMLATASNSRYAEAVAAHLGLFDLVLASNAKDNLSGDDKLKGIKEMLSDESFAYAGNSSVDLPIWAAADEGVLANVSAGVKKKAEQQTTVIKVFDSGGSYFKSLWRAIRPHQWLKNLLLFVPLVLSHQMENSQLLWQSLLGFIAFSLCASSVYLLNDLLDLTADRQHPTKRSRPFAAGDLPISYGVAGMIVLLVMAILVANQLPELFVAVLAFYYVSTLAYSLWLKTAVLVDGLLLAALYATCGTFLGSKASKEADIADRQLQAIQQQYDWDEEIEIPVDGEHYTVAELRLQIQQTVRLIYVIYYVLAGIMLGLFLWARRSPIPAITTALCLWLALIVYQAIFDPSTILKGGGWLVKPLFIGIFVGGLRAAFKQQAARRAVAGAVQHSGVETTRRRRR